MNIVRVTPPFGPKMQSQNEFHFTAVEVGVPKLGNCLEIHKCTQASAQLVHSMCTSLDTPCTLELYTCLGTSLGTCVHFQAVSKLEDSSFCSSVCNQISLFAKNLH